MLSANGFAFSATIKGLRTKTGKSRYRLAQGLWPGLKLIFHRLEIW